MGKIYWTSKHKLTVLVCDSHQISADRFNIVHRVNTAKRFVHNTTYVWLYGFCLTYQGCGALLIGQVPLLDSVKSEITKRDASD